MQGVAPPAMTLLQSHWWPGNIRELENLIERLVAITDKEWLTDEDLPVEYQVPVPAPEQDERTATASCSRTRARRSSATSS